MDDDDQALLKKMFDQALREEGRGEETTEVGIAFLDDEAMRALNSAHRGVEQTTDVLSFPLDEPGYLGDIAVSVPRMKEQADMYGHSERRELFFLLVHGFYHLLGYDHATPEEEMVMFAKQEALLNAFGISR
ncbi:MAG: rRNA maturation RNase YbeY [Candidatus Carbobacillus altaicus]|nr:rRNA maturation RNase YbeY [Candidatus Carbobacillus altaicus]